MAICLAVDIEPERPRDRLAGGLIVSNGSHSPEDAHACGVGVARERRARFHEQRCLVIDMAEEAVAKWKREAEERAARVAAANAERDGMTDAERERAASVGWQKYILDTIRAQTMQAAKANDTSQMQRFRLALSGALDLYSL